MHTEMKITVIQAVTNSVCAKTKGIIRNGYLF